MLLQGNQSVMPKSNRLKKVGDLSVAFPARRPPPFGRRVVSCMGAPACVAPFQRTLAQGQEQFFKKSPEASFRMP